MYNDLIPTMEIIIIEKFFLSRERLVFDSMSGCEKENLLQFLGDFHGLHSPRKRSSRSVLNQRTTEISYSTLLHYWDCKTFLNAVEIPFKTFFQIIRLVSVIQWLVFSPRIIFSFANYFYSIHIYDHALSTVDCIVI